MTKAPKTTYKIRLTMPEPELGSFTSKDAGKDQGLMDAFIFCSILEDGWARSYRWTGINGDGGDMPGCRSLDMTSMFDAWIALAEVIKREHDDDRLQQQFVNVVLKLAETIFSKKAPIEELMAILNIDENMVVN